VGWVKFKASCLFTRYNAQKNQKEFKPDLVAKVRGSISLFCHKKRLLSAMITDDSFDNFCARAWVLGKWWVSLSLYPPYAR